MNCSNGQHADVITALTSFEPFPIRHMLRGAISRCAGELLNEIGKAEGTDVGGALSVIFRIILIHVDAAGKATRQRAAQEEL